MEFVRRVFDTIEVLRSLTTAAFTATGATSLGSTLAVTGAQTNAALTTLNGGLSVGAAANHNYASGHADWTLSAAENLATLLTTTNSSADAGVAAIATPTAGKIFIVRNTSGQALTIKASGQTGIAVATSRTAIVMGNGTDFIRITADQAH